MVAINEDGVRWILNPEYKRLKDEYDLLVEQEKKDLDNCDQFISDLKDEIKKVRDLAGLFKKSADSLYSVGTLNGSSIAGTKDLESSASELEDYAKYLDGLLENAILEKGNLKEKYKESKDDLILKINATPMYKEVNNGQS